MKLSAIVDGRSRLSRLDHFHPGGTACQKWKRIAGRLIAGGAV